MTATAATNGKQRQAATAQHSRTIPANWGYVRPEKADKAPAEVVAERIVARLAAGHTVVFPDDASACAGSIYLSGPLQLERLLAG